MFACVYLGLLVNCRGCLGFLGLEPLIRTQMQIDRNSAFLSWVGGFVLTALPLSHTIVFMMLAISAVYLPVPFLLGVLLGVLFEWRYNWVDWPRWIFNEASNNLELQLVE